MTIGETAAVRCGAQAAHARANSDPTVFIRTLLRLGVPLPGKTAEGPDVCGVAVVDSDEAGIGGAVPGKGTARNVQQLSRQ